MFEREVGEFRADGGADLVGGEHVELSLDGAAVGRGGVRVLRRRDPAAVEAEVAQHVLDDLGGDLRVAVVTGDLMAVHVQPQESRLVVQHLLEVRHLPPVVDRVAGEPAAEVVVHPAGRHGVERRLDHRGRSARSGAGQVADHEVEVLRRRELRRPTEPTPVVVVGRSERLEREVEDLGTDDVVSGGEGAGTAEGVGELGRLGVQVVPPVPPGVVDGVEEVEEARHPVPGLGREVGAAVERSSLVVEEDGHRPPAAPGQRLDGLHVDRIDVGTLLAVDLDVDEAFVHDPRRVVVLEGFVGHHVAPVAGRVPDRQEHRDVAPDRLVERLVAPRPPVDGVVGVLAQVGAGFLGQSVHAPDARTVALRFRSMEIRLDGQVALVTGASKGIGKQIAKTLAEAGAKVMLSSRKQDALEAAAADIDGETAVFAANAGDPEQAAACVQTTMDAFGSVDILVNNAATNPYYGAAIDIDLPRYDKTFEVNLRGPLVWTQEAWKASMKENGGSVINIASIGGMTVSDVIGIYDTTKAALIHLTKNLATDLSPGVRVNGIAPGLVKTDMARALWEPAEEAIAKHTPLARLGEPQDIANAALFLSSELSSWMTGHTLVVDGGALISPHG